MMVKSSTYHSDIKSNIDVIKQQVYSLVSLSFPSASRVSRTIINIEDDTINWSDGKHVDLNTFFYSPSMIYELLECPGCHACGLRTIYDKLEMMLYND
jgi:hypothetical protein